MQHLLTTLRMRVMEKQSQDQSTYVTTIISHPSPNSAIFLTDSPLFLPSLVLAFQCPVYAAK